jgi:hypothetical protein
MAGQVKIPFSALTGGSALALLAVNTNTRAYAPDGKQLEGVTGDPRVEVAVLDTLDRFSVTVKALDAAIATVTEEQISESLKSRQYILVEFMNASAAPYAARSGFGVAYSVKADSAKIATPTQTASQGFGRSPKPTT